MEKSSLSYKALKNVSFSFLGYVLPIAFSVFITPVVVHKLGAVDFGIYVLVNTIIGFLSVMDLGLGTALLKYTAEYYAVRDFKNLKSLLDSGGLIFLGLGFLGFGIFFILGKFLLPVFHIGIQQQSSIFIVFLLAGVLFVLNSLSLFYFAVVRAMQRYDVAVTQSMAQLIAFNFSILLLALLGFKLKAILSANIATTFVLLLVQHSYYNKLLPEVRLGLGWSWEQIKKGYRFGIGAFFTNLSGNALSQLDRLFIPLFLGPSALTFYSLPGNVAQKVTGITGASTGIFFPMMSALNGLGDMEKIKSIYIKLFRNITIFAAGLTVPIVFFAHKILQFWVGEDFAAKGTAILIILAPTYFILGIYSPLINFLMGLGKIRFLMNYSILMAVINLGLLVWWVPKYGIIGAAWAYFFAVLPIAFMFYQVEKNILKLSGRVRVYLLLYGKLLVTSLVFWFLAGLYNPLVKNLADIIIIGPLSVVLFFAVYKLLNFFEKEDWELYLNFFRGAAQKFHLLN